MYLVKNISKINSRKNKKSINDSIVVKQIQPCHCAKVIRETLKVPNFTFVFDVNNLEKSMKSTQD